MLFCSNRRRCRVYTGFVHTSIRLHVHTHIYAQISYTMIANGSNIVLGFVAIVYLGPFLSVSILSAIRRKRIRKEKERTGLDFSTMLHFFLAFVFCRKKQDLGKTLLVSDCKSIFRYECDITQSALTMNTTKINIVQI